ncbi:MAG: hypothetical protein IPG32_21515 [Saprospirales bacterium]|nr:hypothetical protein [Saprospirales bacterium]
MTFSLFLSLVGIGWLMIYTVGYGEHYKNGLNYFLTQTDVGKQTIWIGTCLIAFSSYLSSTGSFGRPLPIPYSFSLAFGDGPDLWEGKVKGATSWSHPGGFSLSTAELAKFGACIPLAAYINTYSTNSKQLGKSNIGSRLALLPRR